jgi:hypothetical protein
VLITKFDHDPSRAVGSARHKRCSWPVCTENLIRID